jgi:hypothetical protein
MSAHPVNSETNRSTIVAGSFAPAGTGSPTSVKGLGFTVSRVSAGLFRVTVATKYVTLVSAVATIQLDAAASLFTQIVDADPATGVIDIRVVDVADTETDVSADPSNRINFIFVLSKDA